MNNRDRPTSQSAASGSRSRNFAASADNSVYPQQSSATFGTAPASHHPYSPGSFSYQTSRGFHADTTSNGILQEQQPRDGAADPSFPPASHVSDHPYSAEVSSSWLPSELTQPRNEDHLGNLHPHAAGWTRQASQDQTAFCPPLNVFQQSQPALLFQRTDPVPGYLIDARLGVTARASDTLGVQYTSAEGPSSQSTQHQFDDSHSQGSGQGAQRDPEVQEIFCGMDNCSARYTGRHAPRNVKRHRENAHRREEPAPTCRGCGKSFKRSDAKVKHERICGRLQNQPPSAAIPRGPQSRGSSSAAVPVTGPASPPTTNQAGPAMAQAPSVQGNGGQGTRNMAPVAHGSVPRQSDFQYIQGYSPYYHGQFIPVAPGPYRGDPSDPAGATSTNPMEYYAQLNTDADYDYAGPQRPLPDRRRM